MMYKKIHKISMQTEGCGGARDPTGPPRALRGQAEKEVREGMQKWHMGRR
jgi:hypothetical protein